MPTIKNKYLFFFIIAAYIILLGYFRDHVFLNINFRLSQLYYNNTFDYVISPDLKFIENYSYVTLFISKWVLTAIFCLLYFTATYLVIKHIFIASKYLKWTLIAHGGIVVFALLLFGVLKLFGNIEMAYKFPRWFMGWLQSPIMMFILIPLFKLDSASKNNHE
jgi:hypothetical protein